MRPVSTAKAVLSHMAFGLLVVASIGGTISFVTLWLLRPV
jgi:hypothetical protein